MVQELPEQVGIELANWNWRVVRQYVSERFGIRLSRSSCLNWLHRLGFAFKRPKKRLLKANEAKREVFVAEYAALWEEAKRSGGKIFFADEAHFRADAELRGKWVLRGEPALVDSSCQGRRQSVPFGGEKLSHWYDGKGVHREKQAGDTSGDSRRELGVFRFFQGFGGGILSAVTEAVAVAVHLQDMDVVGESVQQRSGEPF